MQNKEHASMLKQPTREKATSLDIDEYLMLCHMYNPWNMGYCKLNRLTLCQSYNKMSKSTLHMNGFYD